MQCPVCDTPLRVIERSGIEIDICPGCKGIWLDRGELEKILAMEGGQAPLPSRPDDRRLDDRRAHDGHDQDRDHGYDRDHDRGHDRGYGGHGRQRRGSWLGDLLGGLGGDD
jgi:Zn-finger nucleic acid-binding protein